MNLYPIFEALSTGLVVLTTICYFYQIIYLILPLLLKDKPHRAEKTNRYAILIAARNEEAVLPHLLDSIAAQNYPKHLIRTFVVADNCTDRTAELAAAHGATVFSRFNKQQIGKGYALNYLLSRIDETEGLSNFDTFLIFDADNLLEPDYVLQINRVASDGYDAFCGYRNSKNFGANWLSAGYGLWYLHDSVHMNRSRMRLGTPCAVNGTGFGFTRNLLERMGGWNFFTLTEDIEFTTWCATRGIRVGYCHDAVLYDEQPTSLSVSIRQRTRWVQGGLQVSIRYAKDLLKGLFQGGRTTYASFETATLSLWGYGMSILSAGSVLMVAYLTGRWAGLAEAIGLGILWAYISFFLIGLLTMATEHRRIKTGLRGKILALVGFPIFMLTYAPIALTAPFRKFQWQPIQHTVAIAAKEL